ncbi:MAG: peptidylprolyl isomerase [Gemmatimonadota bacterium]
MDDLPAVEGPHVVLETNRGDIVLGLYPTESPATVENFLSYVREGFYDGLLFHRVISGFMAQGGGFEPGLVQKQPTHAEIRNESDNGLKNLRGSIAMARLPGPHTASAQFFINLVDNAFLDYGANGPGQWGYAVFGRVLEGMDVVDEIGRARTRRAGPLDDVPVEDIVIRRAYLRE